MILRKITFDIIWYSVIFPATLYLSIFVLSYQTVQYKITSVDCLLSLIFRAILSSIIWFIDLLWMLSFSFCYYFDLNVLWIYFCFPLIYLPITQSIICNKLIENKFYNFCRRLTGWLAAGWLSSWLSCLLTRWLADSLVIYLLNLEDLCWFGWFQLVALFDMHINKTNIRNLQEL